MSVRPDSDEWTILELHRFRKHLLDAVKTLSMSSSKTLAVQPINSPMKSSDGYLSCSRCPGFRYLLPEDFRQHCKSEWHMWNICNPSDGPRTFDQWSSLETREDDMSSSSCDDNAPEEDCHQPSRILVDQIPFNIIDGGRLALPAPYANPSQMLNASLFSVLLFRAGRFAGAVWDAEGNVLVHTTIKRYTVRRKNGGSQSKNDKSKGSPAQSIGAQLRREQEKKLREEVGEIVNSNWNKYFLNSSCIVFAYASKSLVDGLMVGPLNRVSPKCTVLKVPMSVHDPTFSEVCRIHKAMTSFAIKR
jgi:hypothetical protein